jgi:hypothetical protein
MHPESVLTASASNPGVHVSPHKTFDAYLVNDPTITAALKKMHATR